MQTVYADMVGMDSLTPKCDEIVAHKFEIAGLGKAPFMFTEIIERVYVAHPGAPSQPSGTCAYCGNGIKYCCVIRDASGKTFEVGNECVKKTGDAGMVKVITNAFKIEQRKKRNAMRAAKAAARYEAERPAREARAAAYAAQIAAIESEQSWLITILSNCPGNFSKSIAEELKVRRFADLSPKVREIVTEIYGKQYGRYNSKAYYAAIEAMHKKLGYSDGIE